MSERVSSTERLCVLLKLKVMTKHLHEIVRRLNASLTSEIRLSEK